MGALRLEARLSMTEAACAARTLAQTARRSPCLRMPDGKPCPCGEPDRIGMRMGGEACCFKVADWEAIKKGLGLPSPAKAARR